MEILDARGLECPLPVVKTKELLKEISALKEMIVRSQFEGRDDFNVWDRFKESTHLVSKPYVLWQMDFARVFKEKGGFSIGEFLFFFKFAISKDF